MSEKQQGNPTTGDSSAAPMPGLSPSDAPKPVVPDYELIKPIGRGSYGEVWLGRNATGSYRAVKVVYRHTFEADKPFEREFTGIQEFEPISRSHPAQIDILHVGRNDEAGYFYYVMELADDESAETEAEIIESAAKRAVGERQQKGTRGSTTSSSVARPIHPDTYAPRTLGSVLRERGRLPVEECLQIALALAEALEHLHAHGLVHRDIKPSNVIFVNGRPKLADIGLVARADATLSFVGTEGYLPPEGPGKPQADIYSLGKVFYQMATGRDRNEFPEPPVGIEQAKDHRAFLEFNEIILKACEDLRERRYRSASDLVDDVKTLQAGKSVRWKNLISRTVRRSIKFAAALAVLALIAFLAVRAFRPSPAGIMVRPGPPLNPSFQADWKSDFRWRYQDTSPDGKRIVFVNDNGRLFLYENDRVEPLFEDQSRAWSFFRFPTWASDSRTIAVPASHRGSGDRFRDLTILVGDVETGKIEPISDAIPGALRSMVWHPGDKRLAILTYNPTRWLDIDRKGTIHLWTGLEEIPMMMGDAAYSPDGRGICGYDQTDLWLIQDGGGKYVPLTHSYRAEAFPAWGPDDTLYFVRMDSRHAEASSSQLMRMKIDPDSGRPMKQPELLHSEPWGVMQYLKIINNGEQLQFFNKKTEPWIHVAPSSKRTTATRAIARGVNPQLSPDGSKVYYLDRAVDHAGIYAQPIREGGSSRELVPSAGIATDGFHLSADETMLAYAHVDEEQRILVTHVVNLRQGKSRIVNRTSVPDPNTDVVGDFQPRFSPDGKWLALSSDKGQALLLINPHNGELMKRVELPGINHKAPAWSPESDYIASVLYDHSTSDPLKDINYRIEVYSLEADQWTILVPAGAFHYIYSVQWRPRHRGELTFFAETPGLNHYSISLDNPTYERLLPEHHAYRAFGEYEGVWDPKGELFYFSVLDAPPGTGILVYDDSKQEVRADHTLTSLPFFNRDGSTVGWVDNVRHLELKVMELK